MPPTPVPLSQVDLTNLDTFARNEAWGQFDTLRREAPVFWNPEPPPNSGFWAITRHADITAIDKDPETFTSTKYVNLEELDDGVHGSPAVDAGDRRGAPPGVAQVVAARFRQPDASTVRRLPARPDPSHGRRGPGAGRVRLRHRDRRRSAHPGSGAAARCPGGQHRAAHRLGRPDHRQHRSRLCLGPARYPGKRPIQAPAVPIASIHRRVRIRSPASCRTPWRRG